MSEHGIKSDIEISSSANLRSIEDIGCDRLGLSPEDMELYGNYKAKISFDFIDSVSKRKSGKLILVTAITPTAAGEGKTTTSVGLSDGLNRIGKKSVVVLREPSLGPSFGMKGGAAGGGYAQVVPMSDINLHFTGDFHAITSAHSLLSAMIDNHIYWRKSPLLDSRRISWRRTVDMNDRSLRSIVSSLGGVANGFLREDGFDITPASEVMAILCLATDIKDLERRLGNIIIGYTSKRVAVKGSDIGAQGAMTVLLRDALKPNLAQTLENNPAFIHGGPFANIAHGCNTVLATSLALKLSDYVVTEAGFGADLGAEKFFNIKCRKSGLSPDAVVLVATIRALKMHGGCNKKKLGEENIKALEKGLPNLHRHIENIERFGLSLVVAINRFPSDSEEELNYVKEACREKGINAVIADHWARGGEGAVDLASEVASLADSGKCELKFLYPDNMPLLDKITTVVKKIYRAKAVEAPVSVRNNLDNFEKMGFSRLPVCIAKTQYSFSSDMTKLGAPEGFTFPIREVRLSAGAEFIVAISGNIMTMPGLPLSPAAERIGVDSKGNIKGLF